MVIFLDVKNAVNSAPWRRILAKLREVEVEPYYRKLPLKPQDSGTIHVSETGDPNHQRGPTGIHLLIRAMKRLVERGAGPWPTRT